MRPEKEFRGAYFDTPARAERLQLLLHLVRNAGEVIYLRAPAGAGKTLFAHQLLSILGDEVAIVWVRGGLDADLPSVAADQLGLNPDELGHWPDAILEQIGDQEVLIVVDDADQLELPAVERLAALHARGGRLLLLGRGGLAQTTREWDVQYVDLPPFDAAQSAAFLRSQAGRDAGVIGEDLAAALHHAAHGLPGPLLDGLKEVIGRKRRSKAPVGTSGSRVGAWQWFAGGAVVLALSALLIFQDRINALLAPAVPEPVAETGAPAPPAAGDAGRAVAESQVRDEPPAGPLLAETKPAPPPEITLPELSRVPPQLTPLAGDGGETTPASEQEDTADASQSAPPASAGAARGEDRLGAVMRDALVAAQGVQAGPDSADQPEPAPESAREPPPQTPVQSAEKAPSQAPARAEAERPEPAAVAVAEKADEPLTAKKTAPATSPLAESPVVLAQRPAPVEERSAPAPARVKTPPPTTRAAPVAEPATVVAARTAGGGMTWLKSRPPQHYTLQLVGSRDRAAVEKFVRSHKIAQPYAIFERSLDGRPWYSLIAGDYPDRATAIAARDRLPKALERDGIWPRTFASIHKSL